MRYSFDADVLIYAAIPDHPQGVRVLNLLQNVKPENLFGSVMLLPELLSKPLRLGYTDEIKVLQSFLLALRLEPMTEAVAFGAAQLGAIYKLKPADAVHLATAVHVGADAFITNNRKDFDRSSVQELEIIFPENLPEP